MYHNKAGFQITSNGLCHQTNMQHLPIWYLGDCQHDMVDTAVQQFEQLKLQDAKMGIAGEETNHDGRNTSISFADHSHWFGKVMYDYAKLANEKCDWQYDVDEHESVQFAKYGPNQHYGWHTDTFFLAGTPKDRKITVVCLLNDPTEFEGGEFQMRMRSEFTVPLKKGSIVAFPSILEHRVTPVTSGLRMSATIWLKGPRFK